jgi:hypothetical protein
MRYFLDTEFIERPGTIDLISIGIVCEDGREFYYEAAETDWTRASNWVLTNVHPHLRGTILPTQQIAEQVLLFAPPTEKPEFWGYYADYDWVVFCWLFGAMIDLPNGYPMYCRDIKQLCDSLGNPPLPKQDGTEHHALADARWNKQAWEFLNNLSDLRPGSTWNGVTVRPGRRVPWWQVRKRRGEQISCQHPGLQTQLISAGGKMWWCDDCGASWSL